MRRDITSVRHDEVVPAKRELAGGVGAPIGGCGSLRKSPNKEGAASVSVLGIPRSLTHVPHPPELEQPLFLSPNLFHLFFILHKFIFAGLSRVFSVELQVFSSSVLHPQVAIFLGEEFSLQSIRNLPRIFQSRMSMNVIALDHELLRVVFSGRQIIVEILLDLLLLFLDILGN